ncbi:hypothetical protein D9M71_272550 [compost metagenome]
MVGDELQFFIGLVARVFFQAGRQAVGVADRLLGFEDDLFGGLGAHVGQVAHDADAVHLGDDLATEAGQAAVTLVAAGAHQVLRVVAHLHDAHAQLLEHLDVADLVFERVGVLEAVEDAGLALLLGLADVSGGAHRDHQIAVLADQLVAGGDVVHRGLEPFPHRHGAVGGGQAALAHVFEEFTVPFGDDQTVNDDAVCVQFGWAHQAVPCYPCAESSAGALRGAYPRGIRRYRAKATGVLPKASSRSRMGKQGSEPLIRRGWHLLLWGSMLKPQVRASSGIVPERL